MSRLSGALTLALLLLGATAATIHAETGAGADPAAAEAGARAVFERNLAAIESRDAAAYLACYLDSERLVRNGFGGVQLGFAGLAAGIADGWPDRFEARDLVVHAVNDDVVYGQYRYRVSYGDEVQEGISERIFLRTADGWRIAVTTAFGAPAGALPLLSDDDSTAAPVDGKDR